MARLPNGTRTFSGRSALGVKRDVLAYWHTHQGTLGLSLKDFLGCCRQSGDGLTVTFRQDAKSAPTGSPAATVRRALPFLSRLGSASRVVAAR